MKSRRFQWILMPQSWKVTSAAFRLALRVIIPKSCKSHSMQRMSSFCGSRLLLIFRNKCWKMAQDTSDFFSAFARMWVRARQEFSIGGTLLQSQMRPFTASISSNLPSLSSNFLMILLQILSSVRISELILQIRLAMKMMASFLQSSLMSLYLWQMMDSICGWEYGWKMMVQNFHRDCNLPSSFTTKSITFEMSTRTSLAPTLSHSSMLYRKFCSLITWSISSSTTIFVFSYLPISFKRQVRSAQGARPPLRLPAKKRSRRKAQMRLTVRMDMQFRQATLMVFEFCSKNSSTLVMRDVLPQPVFPCRQRGELLPFYELEMNSKIRLASATLPGTFLTTVSKRCFNYGDLSPSLSSLLGLGLLRCLLGGFCDGVGEELSCSQYSSGRSSHSMSMVTSQGSQQSLHLSMD